jgi:predicted DNA-binding transcriptional regulator AlpA
MTVTTTPTPSADAIGDAKGTKPTVRSLAPPELADVALIDAPRIAAAACMSLSSWHELVRTGQAPQPVMRAPRCTRWRLADVRAWLAARAERGSEPRAARTSRHQRPPRIEGGAGQARAARAGGSVNHAPAPHARGCSPRVGHARRK